MAEALTLHRAGPLAGRRGASVMPLPPLVRFSFRGGPAATARVAEAFGVAPGAEACRAVENGAHAALWLGPDEWMLVGFDADASALATGLEAALASEPHSLVDISHRNTGFTLDGAGAVDLLAEGCPLDLALPACPVGFCSRTVLGKAEVVLWRRGDETFHLECWRSYAPYLAAFLDQAARNQYRG